MGFQLKLHPAMKGSANHPDFYAVKHHTEIYLEAKVDYSTSERERSQKRIRYSILDRINDVSDGKYGIILEELDLLSSKKCLQYRSAEISPGRCTFSRSRRSTKSMEITRHGSSWTK